MTGGAHGLGTVDGLDDPKLYVTAGTADGADLSRGRRSAARTPRADRSDRGPHPLPGLGTSVAYDDASQMVHILGARPGCRRRPARGRSTSSMPVGNPSSNAVYADARLPDGFDAGRVGRRHRGRLPDRRPPAAPGVRRGRQHGVDRRRLARVRLAAAGRHRRRADLRVCLYLLARILFKRRLVAGLVGLFVLLDGMFFVQSRIGMNDVYVGLFIVAAYTLFAAIWTGWWRSRCGVLGGDAAGRRPARAWPSRPSGSAAYAIGALVLLLLRAQRPRPRAWPSSA